jgi:hypothetical protein
MPEEQKKEIKEIKRMNTAMTELNLNEMEAVTGGSTLTKVLHIVGGVTAATVGFVTGPVGALVAGTVYAAAEIAIDKIS